MLDGTFIEISLWGKNSARHIFTPLINVQTPAEAIISCDSEEMLVPTEYNSADAYTFSPTQLQVFIMFILVAFTRFKAVTHFSVLQICCFWQDPKEQQFFCTHWKAVRTIRHKTLMTSMFEIPCFESVIQSTYQTDKIMWFQQTRPPYIVSKSLNIQWNLLTSLK